MKTNAGIDYGRGLSNIDSDTGIRYGVIHQREVGDSWFDSSQEILGCENCDVEKDDDGYCNHECEPMGFTLDDGEYVAEQTFDDPDIFIIKSPFYTLCSFCSPCAPGAGYIMEQNENGIKAYCFGHDWFEDGKAPYRVFNVFDDTEVLA